MVNKSLLGIPNLLPSKYKVLQQATLMLYSSIIFIFTAQLAFYLKSYSILYFFKNKNLIFSLSNPTMAIK
jgi:hypothetical protein